MRGSSRRAVAAAAAVSALSLGIVGAQTALAQGPARGTVRGSVHIIERGAKASKDLGNAVVYLVDTEAKRASHGPPETQIVNMTGREFEPHVQIVRVGGSVAYPNRDPFSHNVFSNSRQVAFDLGLYRSGASRAAVFDREGVHAIYCNIHARMVNYVVAVNTPHVTRVDRKGTFELKDVPAGTYRMHVWHERASEVEQSITVPASGFAMVTVSLDARSFAVVPHTDKFGKPYASTRADRY